ncbi:hypothetical protein CL631_02690 [bacterium]|jgi:glycosyltransferase involved in cell wall biosynthesis|nr:hypothetical protein [bacterium]MDP6659894.1 glycosyltransferase family 4 protein [Candidatus Paceibacterota bacterium]|tara:strand:- start:49240 stop:50424 length:1185 start_codon:yes stop_codon:yes gene_type:complete
MKRVVIFSTNYFPNVAGAEIAIDEIAKRADGIEFHLITTRFSRKVPAKERIGNVIVHRVGVGSGFAFFDKLLSPFFGAFKAYQLDKKKPVDLFWCMMVTFTCGAPYILNTLRSWRKIKIVLTLQEGDSEEHLTKRHLGLNGLAWKLALKRADVLTVISTYLGKRAKRLGYSGPIHLIPNAVNISHFSQEYSKDILKDLEEKLGKKKGDVFMITTSRLSEKNALDDVIEAVALLPKNIHFIVLGIGEDESKLKRLADDRGVGSRVHFVGYVGQDEIPKYLKISEIFIRPSRSEGFGISFVEAMAAEIPVISTQEGGIADFLFDAKRNPQTNSTGWAVDKDSPQQIADAVNRILENRDEVGKTVSNAKKMVAENYDWERIARDMQNKVFAPLTGLS